MKTPEAEQPITPAASQPGSATSQPVCTVKPLALDGCERRSYAGFAQSFLPHSHGHYVIGLVREGYRRLVCNGQECELDPGDVVAFNPGDVHGCTRSGSSLFAYDSIVVPKALLDGIRLPGPAHRSPAARAAFETFVQGAQEAANEEGVIAAAQAFADALLPTADGAPDANEAAAIDTSSHGCNQAAALHAYGHLRGHVASPRPIGELARRERLSEYALIRAYKREFAITPSQHLLSMRVDLARDLLARGASPADAAAQAGFSDQAHLTRAFKQRIGSTPAAYRAMAQGGPCR